MKVTINELNSTKRGMEVEIPAEVVAVEMEKALEAYRRRARIPGFRSGRIPLSVVRQRFGKQVEGDVLQHLIEEYAHRALEEKSIQPIQHPILDEYDYRQGQPFVFRTTFEIRPAMKVEDYRGLRVARKEPVVGEDAVERSLDSLRERAARYSPRENRKAEDGDVVVGTLAGRYLVGKGKDFANEVITMSVGSERNHPEFNTQLLGIAAGESKTFQVTYPSDYPSGVLAGRTLEYTLAAREVKAKELPQLDDEFAKEVGDFTSLEALREHVRQELGRRAKADANAEAKDRILTELVEKNEFEVPESMIESQMDRQVEETVRLMILQGIDPHHAEVNWREEREKGRAAATKRVRAMLILEAIAEQEGITVSDEEIQERLQHEARRQKISAEELREQLLRKGHLGGLERQLQREKSLDFLLDQATISREG
ncbi:MAG TPA: trigger factor [Candidatus Polarisedimenticolia bacterium]|nr:trigger factor [Candidatus Polarisedimenticolia bacterium]